MIELAELAIQTVNETSREEINESTELYWNKTAEEAISSYYLSSEEI